MTYQPELEEELLAELLELELELFELLELELCPLLELLDSELLTEELLEL